MKKSGPVRVFSFFCRPAQNLLVILYDSAGRNVIKIVLVVQKTRKRLILFMQNIIMSGTVLVQFVGNAGWTGGNRTRTEARTTIKRKKEEIGELCVMSSS